MIAAASIAHHSPGRTRLLTPSRTWDQEYYRHIEDVIQGLPGVQKVKSNAAAASITIFHENSLAELLQQLNEKEVFQNPLRPLTVVKDGSFENAIHQASCQIDRDLRKATDGEIDLKMIFAMGYFGLSLVQIRRQSFFPAAWVLVMHGLDTLKQRA